MARVRRVLKRQRRLTVHAAQRAVDRPWHRTGLGCTVTTRHVTRRHVRAQALQAFPAQVRARPGRTRGRTIRQSVAERRRRRLGWRACCGGAEGRAPRRDLDPGIPAAATALPRDARGPERRSGAANPRRGPAGGRAPGHVSPRPVASASAPSAGARAATARLAALGLPSRFAGCLRP